MTAQPIVQRPAAGLGDGALDDAHARLCWEPPHPTDLALTVRRLQRGRADPVHRVSEGVLWRTMRTASGTATLRVRRAGAGFEAVAWGDAARDAVASAPGLLGADDDPSAFRPQHPLLELAHVRLRGLRIGRTGDLLEAVVGAVMEQRVTFGEAVLAWQTMHRILGERAPGPAPAGMLAPPPAEAWALASAGEWRRAGVDRRRALVVANAAERASALARLQAAPMHVVDRALQSLPGIGVWTSAEVRQRAFGDVDAISVGDFHLAKAVGHALEGRAFDDAEMVAYLEPWRPQRFRATRLLLAMGYATAPARGPRRQRSPGPAW